jgi:hypothetical protein
VNSVINSSSVAPNGSTQYTITNTSTDAEGGSTIEDQMALINYQGVNAPNYRGYVGWSSVGFSHFGGTYKAGGPIACTGGGQSAIYGGGYGPEYINLVSCTTAVSGTQRISTFVVTFNTNFTTPVNTNTLSAWTRDSGSLYDAQGWEPFGTFNLENRPQNNNVVISTKPVAANGTTQYTITNTSTDADGGSTITDQIAIINFQGANTGQYRGEITWSSNSFTSIFGGAANMKSGSIKSCTGGGEAGIYNAYGQEYVNLVNCTTSVSGITRTSTFVITFNMNFATPLTNNTFSGFTRDSTGLYDVNNWDPYETFDLISCPVGQFWNGSACQANCADTFICLDSSTRAHQNTNCTTDSPVACTYGCSGGACNPPTPTITVEVTPLLVRKGETVQVVWSTENMSSCTVTSNNGASWSGLSGSQTSPAIQQSGTVFTVRCTSVYSTTITDASEPVNIIPVFCEPGVDNCI